MIKSLVKDIKEKEKEKEKKDMHELLIEYMKQSTKNTEELLN